MELYVTRSNQVYATVIIVATDDHEIACAVLYSHTSHPYTSVLRMYVIHLIHHIGIGNVVLLVTNAVAMEMVSRAFRNV